METRTFVFLPVKFPVIVATGLPPDRCEVNWEIRDDRRRGIHLRPCGLHCIVTALENARQVFENWCSRASQTMREAQRAIRGSRPATS
jgi:hypothetical protein